MFPMLLLPLTTNDGLFIQLIIVAADKLYIKIKLIIISLLFFVCQQR